MRTRTLAILAVACLAARTTSASVTINFGLGTMFAGATTNSSLFPAGGLINLLAVTNGTWASLPATLGYSTLNEVFSSTTSSFAPAGTVLVGRIGADMEGVTGGAYMFEYSGGFGAGDELLTVAYPFLTLGSAQPGAGLSGFFYRSSAPVDGSDIGWVAPADGGTYSMGAYTLDVGGSLDVSTFTAGNEAAFGNGFSSLYGDSDADGIIDRYETGTGIYKSPTDTGTDPLKADTDGDGLRDGAETATGIYVSPQDTGTNPNVADTDADGLADGAETHTGIYVSEGNTGTSPVAADTSGDGILDGEAVVWKIDPNTDQTPVLNYLRNAGDRGSAELGLFTGKGLSDRYSDALVMQEAGGSVNLQLQLQTKVSLASGWANSGAATPLPFAMPANKSFLRVQTLGPQ